MKKLTFALWGLVVALAPLAAGQGRDCNEWDGVSHKMHWVQYPEPNDQLSMAVNLGPLVLADDFVCTATGPIRDIHIWGSFNDRHFPEGGPDGLTFELTICSDVPATEDHGSRPGVRLWRRVFLPGQYTHVQGGRDAAGWYDPGNGDEYVPAADRNRGDLFRYDFCIEEEPFVQEEGTIYWLAVKDLSAQSVYRFGWNTTELRRGWNDNAVYLNTDGDWITMRYFTGHPLSTSHWLDLAFAIGNGNSAPMHDFGDAPDSSNSVGGRMWAYVGVAAHFPTVYRADSPPYGPMHLHPRDKFYLGHAVSLEDGADIGNDEDVDGDTGLPQNNLSPRVLTVQLRDSCDHDCYDDGLVNPYEGDLVNAWRAYWPYCQSTRLDYEVTVTDPCATSAYVNMWFDWNRDGDWDDILPCGSDGSVPEWVVQNDTLDFWYHEFPGAGITYTSTSPPFMCPDPTQIGIDDTEGMWVRITVAEQPYVPTLVWKESSIGHPVFGHADYHEGQGPPGGYLYGETEDYYIQPRYDWGDAPDSETVPGYPTLKIHNGARHGIAGPWLGTYLFGHRDWELDGQPDDHALGDDNNGQADEDGVSIPPMIPGLSTDATVEVNGGGGVVQFWVDFNADRAWSAEEKVLDGFLAEGIHEFSFRVPVDAHIGKTFARARISTAGGLNPDGPAADGEVEDHEVEIVGSSIPSDWGDALDSLAAPGYPVLAAHNGARHVIGGPWLGTSDGNDPGSDDDTWGANDSPDAEEDGQPDAHARGDDNDGKDDEDGILIPLMTVGLSTSATIKVSGGGGIVQLWIDFNNDKTWQTGEMVFSGFRPDGVYAIPFGVPSTAVVGTTFARARISTRGGLTPEGLADDGEVEDHEVEIVAPAPTILPAAVTQCPAVATTCPTVLTMCPPTQTQCPVEATKCPSTSTTCPPVQTYCPVESTKCPASSTKCPPVQTQCPVVSTQCPPASTTCPPVQTYCPAENTKCPASSTKCPPVQTACPPSKTQCPTTETQCPPTSTKCVTVYTECPAVQTYCPAVETKCPVVSTQCPPVSTKCPAVLTQCPTKSTVCPMTATRCPPISTRCPLCGLSESGLEPSEKLDNPLGTPCPVVETDCLNLAEYLMTAVTP